MSHGVSRVYFVEILPGSAYDQAQFDTQRKQVNRHLKCYFNMCGDIGYIRLVGIRLPGHYLPNGVHFNG